MRVGVQADVLNRRTMTGVDYYTRGLLRATVDLPREHTFDLCYFGRADDDLGVDGSNVHRAPCWPALAQPYKVLDRYLKAPPFDLLCGVKSDVFLFTDFVAYPLARCDRTLVITYDMAFVDLPQFYRARHQRYLSRRATAAIRTADAVIAISEFTKARVCDIAGVSADKVTVIPPGVDTERFHPVSAEIVSEVRLRHGVPARYILFVGTLTGRKNVPALIAAYRRLPREHSDTALVLIGRPGWQDDGVEAELRRSSAGQVVRLGYVPEADLPALYAGASVFAYPSLYEGFGMPVLEAMASGTPVVTSTSSSLPEAGGDAALLVDPNDSEALIRALSQGLGDGALAASLRQRGHERVRAFTWYRSALALVELLREVAA